MENIKNYDDKIFLGRILTFISIALNRIIIAIRFLTIIPLRIREKKFDDIAHSIVYFPFVGLLMGTIVAILNIVTRNSFPPFLKDIFIISMMIILTGGLHLSGFVDLADNLFKEKKKKTSRIIKETNVDAFGIIYLIILLQLKFIAFHNVPDIFKNKALIIFPMLSRWAMALAILLIENYKNTSYTNYKFIDFLNKKEIFSIILIPVILIVAALKLKGIILIGATLLLTYSFVLYVNKKNYLTSKDIFGAVNEIAELLIITLMAIIY